MSISKKLEKSARAFNAKYACNFDFRTFESRVEEFTLFRPNGGWIDVYKVTFGKMYKTALEMAAIGAVDDLNGEAMLDDFEYTLIRPYVREADCEIKHRPYVGMDRVTRLEYIGRLTDESPKNLVDLYAERYKRGELTLKQIRLAQSTKSGERSRYVEIAGYIQALEIVNKGRSLMWRALHPFRNGAEQREADQMKTFFINEVNGRELYDEILRTAYETYDGHRKASANLAERMAHAREEMSQNLRLNDAMRESFGIGCRSNESAIDTPQ